MGFFKWEEILFDIGSAFCVLPLNRGGRKGGWRRIGDRKEAKEGRKEGSLFWRAFYSEKGLRKIVRPDGDSGDALSAGKCEAPSPLAAELREAD